MHVKQILTRCFPRVFNSIHASRREVLLRSVEALVIGHRLTLTDIARSWPGALFIHAPLKALDRLLSTGGRNTLHHCAGQEMWSGFSSDKSL